MRGDAARRRRALIMVALAIVTGDAGAARAQWYAYDEDRVPLEPPLALPQSINGTIRSSANPVRLDRIDRILDVFSAIRACWRVPDVKAGGLETTVKLSFNRNGQIIDKPRVTYVSVARRRVDRERFLASAFSAFESCSPLPFTAAFGSAVAGRPFTFRFIDDRQS
jgi:hypothetical protein